MKMTDYGSKTSAAAAIKLSLTTTREEEAAVEKELLKGGIKSVAVDYGGEFVKSSMKIIESAIVAAKRKGLINSNHSDEGAVAGAVHEAISQIMTKAIGLNVGGKIAIARFKDNISVSMFVGIGLLHLDEVGIGLGHRVVKE